MEVKLRIIGEIPTLDEEKEFSKCEELLSRLAELGKAKAEQGFSSADYVGDYDISVDINPVSEDTYEIVASGDKVLFVEYGSGTMADDYEGKGYTPDSWSVNHARQFHDKGYWYYNGVKLEGQPPAKAMYEASKTIKNNANKIAKEVFKW